MGRFKHDEVNHYGGTGGAGYFSLKNSGDIAVVRFLYKDIDDMDGYAVHEVEIDGRKRYVNCLRDYTDPVDKCPFCREHKPQTAKLFIPVYNVDEDKVQIWERGKKFFGKLTSVFSRYPDIIAHEFEIERVGEKNSTSTTYEIYETEHDESTLEDFPEAPEILGGVVLDKSADDMEYYLESGEFPPEDDEDQEPVKRRSSRRNVEESDDEEEEKPERRSSQRSSSRRSERRTPASRRKDKEAF